MTAVLVLAAVLGLVVGSFLNVVIHRVPARQSVLVPKSYCPGCEQPIKPRHNIPVVAWLALRGRCAHCTAPISVRYPLVEVVTAALFVALTARFGLSSQLPAYLYLASIAVALAAIDLDVRRLPDIIVLPSYLVGVLLLVPVTVAGSDWSAAARSILAMVAVGLAYYLLGIAYPGGIGFGDVKLAGLLGFYLGWLSWTTVLVGVFGAFLLGGSAAAVLLVTGRVRRRTAIPFGPFMLAAALLALFVAEPVAAWYRHLFPVS
jgi:leader peptidase (prepilin peptidase)/N-methyltransferase